VMWGREDKQQQIKSDQISHIHIHTAAAPSTATHTQRQSPVTTRHPPLPSPTRHRPRVHRCPHINHYTKSHPARVIQTKPSEPLSRASWSGGIPWGWALAFQTQTGGA